MLRRTLSRSLAHSNCTEQNRSKGTNKMKHIWFAATLLLVSQGAWSADLLKAEQLLNAGQAEAALLEAESFLANDPTNADGRFIQGIALAGLNRTDDAIAIFKDLTSDYPGIPEPYNNLAVLLAQSGDYAGARDALEDAVKTHPNYTAAWENLADIYSVMAAEAYEKVLKQNPTNTAAKQRLAAMNGAVNPAPPPASPVPSPAPVAKPSSVVAVAVIEPTQADVEQVATSKADVNTQPFVEPIAESSNAPTPEASIESAGDLSPAQQEVMQAVTEWATHWSQSDINGYLAAYSSNYQPQDNQSRSDWEKTRRTRLAKPAAISLKINQPKVAFLDDNLATVKFVQSYKSDSYNDTVRKTLLMERENNNWLIVREQSIR